jgi:hypothetical protein
VVTARAEGNGLRVIAAPARPQCAWQDSHTPANGVFRPCVPAPGPAPARTARTRPPPHGRIAIRGLMVAISWRQGRLFWYRGSAARSAICRIATVKPLPHASSSTGVCKGHLASRAALMTSCSAESHNEFHSFPHGESVSAGGRGELRPGCTRATVGTDGARGSLGHPLLLGVPNPNGSAAKPTRPA